jgi:hypothetical protein
VRKSNITGNLKDYFTFSKTEKNGILFLFVILTLVVSGNFLIPQVISKKTPVGYNAFKGQVDSLYNLDTVRKVRYTSSPKNKTFKEYPPKKENIGIIEINSCDSASLTFLPGIGPVFASRIIRYRKLLGGYYSIDQIKEVYGMQPENFEKASHYWKVDSQLVQKFLPDTAGFRTLVRHPYIGKERTYQIMKLKKSRYGGVFSENDLKTGGIFDSLQWEKVKPYFIFRNNP